MSYEYRTYSLRPRISYSPTPCEGTIELENCSYDWRYERGKAISIESLGAEGWRLIHVLPARDGYSVGIFERADTGKGVA
jgi:hypothetical protein